MGYSRSDYFMDIALGKVSGLTYLHKFGRNPDIDTGGFEAIWQGGGPYTGFNVTIATNLEVSSNVTADKGSLVSSGVVTETSKTKLIDENATLISDGVVKGDIVLDDTDRCHGTIISVDSEIQATVVRYDKFAGRQASEARVGDSYRIATATGTGAAVVHLQHLLDANLEKETDEFIIMDGTTVVTTVGEYKRNSRGSVILAGTGLVNAATITSVDATTSVNILMKMPTGYNKSMICAYTIPADCKSAHLVEWFASIAGKVQATSNVRLMVRHVNEANQVFEEFSLESAGSSHVQRDYKVPKDGMPPGSDVTIVADTDSNDTGIAAGMDFIISHFE